MLSDQTQVPRGDAEMVVSTKRRRDDFARGMDSYVDRYRDANSGGIPQNLTAKREGNGTADPVSGIARYNEAIGDSRMSFSFFVESKFIPEHVEHKAPAGRTHYQAILKHILRPETVDKMFRTKNVANGRLKSVSGWPYLDDIQLCNLTPERIRRLLSIATEHGYSVQTVKHIKNVVGAIIRHAEREKCFGGVNPVSQLKLPPMVRRVEHNLTLDQTKALLELMQYPEREIALITITTGMDIQEICRLQWKHVNLSDDQHCVDDEFIPARCIAVREQWNGIGLGDVKRGRARDIPVQEPLLSALKAMAKRVGNASLDDPVLVAQNGKPIVPASVRRGRLNPIGRRLGMPWLSWQVLKRAHTQLLSQFRKTLNDQMIQPSRAAFQTRSTETSSAAGAIVVKQGNAVETRFRCRSFRMHFK